MHILLWSITKHGHHRQFLFLIGRYLKKSSPLKLSSQMNWNLVGSIYMYERLCIKFPPYFDLLINCHIHLHVYTNLPVVELYDPSFVNYEAYYEMQGFYEKVQSYARKPSLIKNNKILLIIYEIVKFKKCVKGSLEFCISPALHIYV